MKVKFVDYDIEHKGYWNYGYKYWFSEQFIDKKGKQNAKILLTTNDLSEVFQKIKDFASQSIKMEFVQNESFHQHKNSLTL